MLRKLLCAVLFCIVFPVCVAAKPGFTFWQLPSQVDNIGNSYVFLTSHNKVIVMDGGVKEEAPYLRGFLAALGNKVAVWFVSHPHPDHIGALNEILKKPGDIKIEKICHSEFSEEQCCLEPDYKAAALSFYSSLKKSGIRVESFTSPGLIIRIDDASFKILGVTNEDIRTNPFNNSSMVIRAWDSRKSIVFLGDCGREEGDRLLNGPYRKDLNCDYLQMAHHGQKGVSKDFYRTIKFKACLWPSPAWVYNNDVGKGYNTHEYETVEIRTLMDELGIKKHYVSNKGLCKIK